MDVTFTLRDVIYIGTYVASLSVVVASMRARIKALEDKLRTVNRVVFQERGGLSVIQPEDCKQYRKEMDRSAKELSDRLKCVEQNIVRIMIHMKLEPVQANKRQIDHGGFHVEPHSED
jgi:hypothetical protein